MANEGAETSVRGFSDVVCAGTTIDSHIMDVTYSRDAHRKDPTHADGLNSTIGGW